MIENHVRVTIKAGKREWSVSPGLDVGHREDTLGGSSLELSLKRLRNSLPGGQGQGEHSWHGEELTQKHEGVKQHGMVWSIQSSV